jgi:hypothetical protein
MTWSPEEHPLTAARRRLRARQIAFLRSTPDPDDPQTTEEVMNRLFGGLPDPDDLH